MPTLTWCCGRRARAALRRDLLPDRRVVVRFEFDHGEHHVVVWMLVERGDAELCGFDPGFGDDLGVGVNDPVVFARWHLGLIDWPAALRTGGIEVTGPRVLRRALPTWNFGPVIHRRQRAEHECAPGATPPDLRWALCGTRPSRRHPRDPARTTAVIPDFEGDLVTADDAGYDVARAVWNGAVDRKPRYVARCRSVSDVTSALRFGREHDLQITVRGGGYGPAGASVCDDGLVVDLGLMKAMTVDPARRSVAAQAGVRWGELDTATQAFGLATTGGVISGAGVSGLTLGGGIGWLMRRHGLTVDNLVAAEVVTAEGDRLTASERENPDLFWGLRGGGGALAVATSFTYRLHPVRPDVLAGPVIWALEDAPAVLAGYREFIGSARPSSPRW